MQNIRLSIECDETKQQIIANLNAEFQISETESPDLAFSDARDIAAIIIDENAIPALHAARLAVCRVPALLLTTLDTMEARHQAIAAGVNACIAAPYDRIELRSRLAAIVHDAIEADTQTLLNGAVEVNLRRRQVRKEGQPVLLSGTEYRILEHLMRHSGIMITRSMLLEHVWGINFNPSIDFVACNVRHLNDRLGKLVERYPGPSPRSDRYRLPRSTHTAGASR